MQLDVLVQATRRDYEYVAGLYRELLAVDQMQGRAAHDYSQFVKAVAVKRKLWLGVEDVDLQRKGGIAEVILLQQRLTLLGYICN